MVTPVGVLIPGLACRRLQQCSAAADLDEVSAVLGADRHECTDGSRRHRTQLVLSSHYIGAVRVAPHYQQSCPPRLTEPPGGPTMTDAISLRSGAAG